MVDGRRHENMHNVAHAGINTVGEHAVTRHFVRPYIRPQGARHDKPSPSLLNLVEVDKRRHLKVQNVSQAGIHTTGEQTVARHFVRPSVGPPVCLSTYLPVCQPICLPICPSVCLPICIYLPGGPSVRPSNRPHGARQHKHRPARGVTWCPAFPRCPADS